MRIHKTFSYDENIVLGKGSYGTVYLGTMSSGKAVAVKRMRKRDEAFMATVRNEYAIHAAQNHPNILGLFDFENKNNSRHIYFMLELMQTNLLQVITLQDYTLNDEVRKKILTYVARGLSYLHTKDIVHGDIKPENILLTFNQLTIDVKIADFGLAFQSQPLDGLRFAGSPVYCPPELFSAHKAKDLSYAATDKHDIYSFGITSIELWGLSDRIAKLKHYNRNPLENNKLIEAQLSQILEEIPPRMAPIVSLCLRLSPQERPSAQALIEQIKDSSDSLEPDLGCVAVEPIALNKVMTPATNEQSTPNNKSQSLNRSTNAPTQKRVNDSRPVSFFNQRNSVRKESIPTVNCKPMKKTNTLFKPNFPYRAEDGSFDVLKYYKQNF